MKLTLQKITLFIVAFLIFKNVAYSQYISIADTAFENKLRWLGYDDGLINDGKLPTTFIPFIKNLDVRFSNIKDLTGIKSFTALETLNCKNNKLTNLDVSGMSSIKTILCDSNQIASLKLDNCLSLQILSAKSNNLTSISYPQSIYLYDIRVANNKLSTLNIAMLEYLQTLNIENNNFSSLDVKNKFYLQNLNCKGNPLLSCITVTNVFFANENFQKDATSNFKTNCKTATGYTSIPDSAFEASLRQYDLDDSQVNDGKVPTNFIQDSTVKILNLGNKGIKDLTGIRSFTNLVSLDVSFNNLTFLNVYKMKLTNLIASNNPDLLVLNCDSNQINFLGVTGLPKLFALSLSNNNVQSLPLSSFTNLVFFNCAHNKLSTVFSSAMKNLVFITFYGNNVGRVYFDAFSNPPGENLKKESTNAFASLQHLDCGNNPCNSIDVSNLPSLKYLNCSNTNIDSLNISKLTLLDTLNATSNNKLKCIQVADVSNSNAKILFKKDASTIYSTNCKQALSVEDGMISTARLFPNPAKGSVNIQLESESNIIIFNALGEKVYSDKLSKGTHNVSLGANTSGIYHVEISSSSARYLEKTSVSGIT